MRVRKAYREKPDGSKSMQFPVVEFNGEELPNIKYADVVKGDYAGSMTEDEFDGLKIMVAGAVEKLREWGSGIIFNYPVGGLSMRFELDSKGDGFVLKRTGRMLHSITSFPQSLKEDEDPFKDLVSILETGFIANDSGEPNVVDANRAGSIADYDSNARKSHLSETQGDRYSIEFYPQQDKVTHYVGGDIHAPSSPSESITRVNILIDPGLGDGEREKHEAFYRERLRKYGIPLNFTKT